MNKYKYHGVTPIEYGENFCDSYIKNCDAVDLPAKGMFTYHQGVFLSGMEHIYKQNGNKKYFNYIKSWVDSVLNDDGTAKTHDDGWTSHHSLDFRQPGLLMFNLYSETKDERYFNCLIDLVETLKDYPRNSKGGFWHMKSQPNQMWLDGLYMAGPLLAKYAYLTGKSEILDNAISQAVIMDENMTDPVTGLMYHGWDEGKQAQWAKTEHGLSSEFWGRALGWYTIAILDILDYVPEEHLQYRKLVDIVTSLLKSLAKFQDESGRWYQVTDKIDKADNWLENSCSCMFVYSFSKAVRMGYLDGSYIEIAKKGFEGVIDSLRYTENGEMILGDICVGTCIDEGTYEHYIKREKAENDLHGGGAFLLMCAQVNNSFDI